MKKEKKRKQIKQSNKRKYNTIKQKHKKVYKVTREDKQSNSKPKDERAFFVRIFTPPVPLAPDTWDGVKNPTYIKKIYICLCIL